MKNTNTNSNPEQDLYSKEYKRLISVDFDGVIHSYQKGWNKGVIYDEPVEGAFTFLAKLVKDDRFSVAIYSSRSKMEGGIAAMQAWMYDNGLPSDVLCELEFPTEKPPAWITIDDRCFQFRGVFPTPGFLLGYVPWNKEPEGAMTDADALRTIAGSSVYAVDKDRLLQIANRLDGLRTE